MDDLELTTEKIHNAYFVDLFVRVSNTSAIQMYKHVSHPALAPFGTGAIQQTLKFDSVPAFALHGSSWCAYE